MTRNPPTVSFEYIHPLNFQNWAIEEFRENLCFTRSNDRKTTFEWPKVVFEVISPGFRCRFQDIVICEILRKTVPKAHSQSSTQTDNFTQATHVTNITSAS